MTGQKRSDLAGQLSKRLQSVLALAEPVKTVADVGCDHGYVAISLIQQHKASRVIAMDVRKGPLDRAKGHIIQYGMKEFITTRLSDGVEALSPGEADGLICAGMGGKLMVGILERGAAVIEQMQELILQPQSELSFVREWLRNHAFSIDEECMVCEDNKFYPMFRVKPEKMLAERDSEKTIAEKITEETINRLASAGMKKTATQQRVEDRYGPLLLQRQDPVLYRFLQKEREVYTTILQELVQTGKDTENTARRRAQLLEYLQDIDYAQMHYDADRSTI